MNEIDELFRDYLSDVPEAAPGTGQRLGRYVAVSGSARPRRIRLRPWSRRVTAVLGGLGAAGFAAVLVILLVQAPTTHEIGAQTFGEPRVTWGLTATIRVTPIRGTSPEDAMAQVVRALESRARQSDIPGLGVAQAGSNLLRVTLPGAETGNDLAGLMSFINVDVFNLSTSLIASGSGLGDLLQAAKGLSGRAVRYAVQGSNLSQVQIVHSQADADRLLQQPGFEKGVTIPLPDGVLLVDRQSANLPRIMLIRDQPVLTANQIERASFAGSRFEIVPSATDRAAVASSLDRASATAGSLLSVVKRETDGRGYEYGASTQIERTATRITLEGFAENSYDHAAFAADGEPIVAATVAVESALPYGTVPLPAGDHDVPLPASLAIKDLKYLQAAPLGSGSTKEVGVEDGSIVQAVSASAAGRTWSIYAGRTIEGREASWIGVDQDNLGFSRGGQCGPGVGIPSLRGCGSLGIGKVGMFYGRARVEVASIEARTQSGTTLKGTIRNGWYLIPYTETSARRALQVDIVARDSSGRVIANLDRFGRLTTASTP